MENKKISKHNLYYLCRGTNVTDFKNCCLTKLQGDDFKGLENIDLFTSKYPDYQALKEDLLSKGYLKNSFEDLVIAQYKSEDEGKRLVPIFLKDIITKNELDIIGLDNFESYSELADKVYAYIMAHKYDRNFLLFLITSILDKYLASKREVNIPILKDEILVDMKDYLSNENFQMDRRMEIYLERVFISELFEYTIGIEQIDFKVNKVILKYEKKEGTFKSKGLHDMLIRVCEYIKTYDKNLYEEREIEEYYNDVLYEEQLRIK